jgi:hypothetical protein
MNNVQWSNVRLGLKIWENSTEEPLVLEFDIEDEDFQVPEEELIRMNDQEPSDNEQYTFYLVLHPGDVLQIQPQTSLFRVLGRSGDVIEYEAKFLPPEELADLLESLGEDTSFSEVCLPSA